MVQEIVTIKICNDKGICSMPIGMPTDNKRVLHDVSINCHAEKIIGSDFVDSRNIP
jgi:hypothetical protein